MNVSVNEIQLKKSENAWKPGMKRPEVVAEDPVVQDTQVCIHMPVHKHTEKKRRFPH